MTAPDRSRPVDVDLRIVCDVDQAEDVLTALCQVLVVDRASRPYAARAADSIRLYVHASAIAVHQAALAAHHQPLEVSPDE